MKKVKFQFILLTAFWALLFPGCPIEGNLAILTIKNQSSLEITTIKIWRGTKALEEAKARMADAEFNVLIAPSRENVAQWLDAMERYDEEVEKTCLLPPEVTDTTGIAVNEIKSWELKSGSILVKAICDKGISSPYVVNFGGDHAVRFIGQQISNPDGDKYDWE
jgi:hypothetical protein